MEKYILQVHWLSEDEIRQYLCAGVAGSFKSQSGLCELMLKQSAKLDYRLGPHTLAFSWRHLFILIAYPDMLPASRRYTPRE